MALSALQPTKQIIDIKSARTVLIRLILIPPRRVFSASDQHFSIGENGAEN
jgi:hypothetical protein